MTSRDFTDRVFLEHKSIMTGIWDEGRPPAFKLALHLIYQLSVKLVINPFRRLVYNVLPEIDNGVQLGSVYKTLRNIEIK